MIVVDTSAWIELFRKTAHPVASILRELLERREDVAITELIYLELLAGAPSGTAFARLRSRLLALPILRPEGLADYEEAAEIYRACRAAGQTPRSQIDCLIAVAAIRQRASLLHNDRDYELIARHTTLKVHAARG